MVKKLTKYVVTARRNSGGTAKVSFGTKKEAENYMQSIGYKAKSLKAVKGRMVHHPRDKSTLIFKPYKWGDTNEI